MSDAVIACPACGGSGGGPFGRRGGAWDAENYECPRCQGAGVVRHALPAALAETRPLAKATSRRPESAPEKRGPVSTRPAAPDGATAVGGGRKG